MMKTEQNDARRSNTPSGTSPSGKPANTGHMPDADVPAEDAAVPSAGKGPPPHDNAENRGYNQRGYGKGGKSGLGEPDGVPVRDGSTQPDFGQGNASNAAPDPGR
jgi:hypothetical protein